MTKSDWLPAMRDVCAYTHYCDLCRKPIFINSNVPTYTCIWLCAYNLHTHIQGDRNSETSRVRSHPRVLCEHDIICICLYRYDIKSSRFRITRVYHYIYYKVTIYIALHVWTCTIALYRDPDVRESAVQNL